MTEQLDWAVGTTDIPRGGLHAQREASEAERRSVAQALGLIDLGKLEASYRVASVAGDAYRLTGRIHADVVQACVITLEPVGAAVEADFDVEFRPALEAAETGDDLSVLDGPDVEMFEHGIIPVGRIVFETLSASLDPYPRRDGAAFDWQDPNAGEPEKSGPFAVLSKLKDKS